MTPWAVLAGALAAALVAWTAITVIAWLGRGRLSTKPLRWMGAAALGALALDVAGAPVPWVLPVVLLSAGFLAGLVPVAWASGDS